MGGGGSISYVFFLYTLLKVVSRDDLSVLSMSVAGLQKKNLLEGWVGGVSYIHFWTVFNFANPLTRYVIHYFTMVTIQCTPRLLPTHHY